MTSFRAIREKTLEDMKKQRDLLNQSIIALEVELASPPFVSHVDYELIQFITEDHLVKSDLWEQKRDKG